MPCSVTCCCQTVCCEKKFGLRGATHQFSRFAQRAVQFIRLLQKRAFGKDNTKDILTNSASTFFS
jgi:hypothetical protein